MTLIEDIARAGFQIMIFSGGEPLLRPDIFDLIHHAREVGLRPVLGTNGTLLTLETARALKDAGLMAAGISLDSLMPLRMTACAVSRRLAGGCERYAALPRCRAAVSDSHHRHGLERS